MAYHDDLLTQALQLIRVTPPSQLALRRAVSAAYYAVFHYLIAEATSNWNNVPLRTALGRGYDHSTMKAASNRILNLKDFPYTGGEPTAVANLRFVAQTFSQLQEDRHFADYNLTKDLDPVEALTQVKSAEKIFTIWSTIREEQIVQAYLVSLLVKRA
jgi:hypothetical protein